MTAVQNQDYQGDALGNPHDRDPNNHTVNDTYSNINQAYFFEQTKATIAMAGHLLEPIFFLHRICRPLVFCNRF